MISGQLINFKVNASSSCALSRKSQLFHIYYRMKEIWKIVNESNFLGNADIFFTDSFKMIDCLLVANLSCFNSLFSKYSKYTTNIVMWPLEGYLLVEE